jgi:hypothetical protein
MAFQNFPASRLWRQPLDVRVGRERYRAVSAEGRIGVEFTAKLFPASGRPTEFRSRVKLSSSTLVGTIPTMLIIGGGGFRLQCYWKFQYDLDIGAFSRLTRSIPGARELANSRVQGLSNIIQSFDLVPPKRQGRPYTAKFRNMRGDNRPRGASRWEWDFNHNRTIRGTRAGPSIVTTTRARLPVEFSGSLSAGTSGQVGASVGWELGPAGTVSASAGTSAGASLNINYRRSYELRLIGNFAPLASK